MCAAVVVVVADVLVVPDVLLVAELVVIVGSDLEWRVDLDLGFLRLWRPGLLRRSRFLG